MNDQSNASGQPNWQGMPPSAPPPPSGPGWQGQMPPSGGWPPQPQIIVKKGPGCFLIGLIVLGVFTLLAVGAVVVLALVAKEAVDQIEDATGEAAVTDYDVRLDSCVNDEILGPQATGVVTNTSDKKQGFRVVVRFTNAEGVLISEDSNFMDALDVGQAGTWTVSSLDQAEGNVKCDVTSVAYHIFDNED